MRSTSLSGFACGIAARDDDRPHHDRLLDPRHLYELDAIAAVVIGGTLLSGGRGTIVGTVFGVLIFTTLTNVFTLNNLATSAQAVAKGAIIVAAVLLQQRARRAPPQPPSHPQPPTASRADTLGSTTPPSHSTCTTAPGEGTMNRRTISRPVRTAAALGVVALVAAGCTSNTPESPGHDVLGQPARRQQQRRAR